MTDSRSITGILIFVGILLFGLWLGISIVTDKLQTLMYVSGGAALIICALLGRRVWMILPFAAALNLTLMISGEPNTILLAQALFLGFSALQFLIRQLKYRIKFTELELWIGLLTVCIIQAYVRNPIGLNIFGGDSIGARPYVIYAVSLTSCLVISILKVSATDLRWIMRLSIIGGLINFAMLAIGYYVPRIGVWYGSVNHEAFGNNLSERGTYGVEKATRIEFVRDIANNLALWISSFISPLRACFHPIWAPLVGLSLAFAALSGFRSEIAAVGFTYLVGIAYRGGFTSVFISIITLVMGVGGVALINLTNPLPSNIQRSLSFLPGTWDQVHVADAENSNQWRIDMWEAALLTDHWIKNKTLGDGLGMTRDELEFIKSMEGKQTGGVPGAGKLYLDQELMMASNNYHSGPVTTIRTIGYVGLAILLLAQIRLAVHAHRLIKQARKTNWFPLTLFIGIPIIWSPVFFVFIFGDFGPAIASLLFGTAMVRLLENNLPRPIKSENNEITQSGTVSISNA
jgi:hypothetical protein